MKLQQVTAGYSTELLSITDKELVRDIQQHLANSGFMTPSQVDGIVGKITTEAFARFKKALYLDHPDTLGYTTAQALLKHKRANGFFMPTNGVGWLSSPYGTRSRGFHKGIDIAANAGTPVYAIEDGIVAVATKGCSVGSHSCGGGYGNCVYLNHGNNAQSRYAHLTAVSVQEGQKVKKGEMIGTVGNTGHSFGDHLHFEYRVANKAIDPQTVLRCV